jgi:hypothetical protein
MTIRRHDIEVGGRRGTTGLEVHSGGASQAIGWTALWLALVRDASWPASHNHTVCKIIPRIVASGSRGGDSNATKLAAVEREVQAAVLRKLPRVKQRDPIEICETHRFEGGQLP